MIMIASHTWRDWEATNTKKENNSKIEYISKTIFFILKYIVRELRIKKPITMIEKPESIEVNWAFLKSKSTLKPLKALKKSFWKLSDITVARIKART